MSQVIPTFHPCMFRDVRLEPGHPQAVQYGFRYYFRGHSGYSTDMISIPDGDMEFIVQALSILCESMPENRFAVLVRDIARKGCFVGPREHTPCEALTALVGRFKSGF